MVDYSFYTFHVDGPETARVVFGGTAFVYDLSYFDTTDSVWAMKDYFSSCTLAFEINGDIDLDLTSYPGIVGFARVTAQSATGGVHLTINPGPNEIAAASLTNGTVVLDARAAGDVFLDARSDGSNVLLGGASAMSCQAGPAPTISTAAMASTRWTSATRRRA
ncbi:MAG: hypothetical protein ACRC67_19425 [Inquilinus sp.]|uniref:hypothetical protein n=1 Tax=Inquilinus sp. TaxID=1932117 RepID=UPI003F3CEB67